jgi:hypothetical protein
MSTRRLAIAAALAIAAVSPGSTTSAAAASAPYPLRVVEITGDVDTSFFSVAPTPDARFALLSECCGDRFRLDLETGATVPIDFGGISATSEQFSLSGDGRFAYVVDGTQIRRVTVLDGTIVDFDVPFTTDFLLRRVADGDATGRFLLLSASSGGFAAQRVFVFDTVSGQLVTPDPDGVSTAMNVTPLGMSDDGRFVTTSDFVVGGGAVNVVRWDRTTDQRTTIEPPPEHDPIRGQWVVSPDLRWALFIGTTSNIVPGLDATTRLYRRNLATGVTQVVPVGYDNLVSYAVADGGRVILVEENETPARPDARQVLSWDGSGPALIFTRAPGGELADLGIEGTEPSVSVDGTTVVFVSIATNLVPGSDPNAFTRRLFTVSLPPIGTVNATAVVQPGETYCLAAVGADPGDFVGVNVTPLLAVAPGFGVLHSSDDAPGGTSNVNFGPGTVDPNVAFAQVGADGRICFTNSVFGPVHLLLDQLIVADAAVFRSPSPSGSVRLADTRIGLGGGILAPSETRCVAAVGAAPGEFVGVNVLPIAATAAGFGTLHPSGSGPGASSTANFGPGTFDPNFAFTKVGPDGQICFTNSVHGPVHVLLDELIVGVSTALAAPSPGPNSDRPVDTRLGLGSGTLAPGASVCFTIPGGAPGDFGGVNLLPLQATGPGFGTLRSSDDAPGSTSNANFGVGTFDPNFAIAEFGADGRMCFTNSENSTVDVIVDSQVIADASAFSQPTSSGSVRLVDTRIGRA